MPEQQVTIEDQELDTEDSSELVPAAKVFALAPRYAGALTASSAMDRLATMEDAIEIIQRKEKIIQAVRQAALKLTSPRDWVQMLGKNMPVEEATCLLTSSGARKIGPQLYGIALVEPGPVDSQGVLAPIEQRGEDDEVSFTLFATAIVGLTGETIPRLTASRSSSEKFIGRGGLDTTSALVARGDLTEAVKTLLYTKAVRVGAGMGSVPVKELAAAWKGTDKKIDYIPKGSGFGSSSQRQAQAVASEDVKAGVKKLADEIFARVGGDADAARRLTTEITAGKNFAGFDDVRKISKKWQLENAWGKLKKHAVHGDGNGENGD